jgi:hypothetical protein
MNRLGGIVVAAAALLARVGVAAAGSVSGQAVDEDGAPLAGIHVEVVNGSYQSEQILGYGASIKAETVTGADGRYRIDTDDLPPGEYSAHAYRVVLNGGRQLDVDLVAEDSSAFASNAATIRNFAAIMIESSEALPYGNGGVFIVNNAIGDFTDLGAAEVTLASVETGKTYVKTVRSTGEGLAVTGIPFGTYRASVKVAGQPMQIALWGPDSGAFSSSVVHDFTMGYAGNEFQVQVKPQEP